MFYKQDEFKDFSLLDIVKNSRSLGISTFICMKQSLDNNQIWTQKFKCKRVHYSIIYIILKILAVKNEITNKRGMDYYADTKCFHEIVNNMRKC